VIYLTLPELLYVALRALGSEPGVRDYGLLESALARPQATAFGSDAYPGPDAKAAALLHSLARNHALIDGNKRIAWLATVVFCDLNGSTTSLSDDEAFQLVWDVASSDFEVTLIAARLNLLP